MTRYSEEVIVCRGIDMNCHRIRRRLNHEPCYLQAVKRSLANSLTIGFGYY
jgi:hypothetical protein